MGEKVSYLIFNSITQKSIFFLSETFISSNDVFDPTIRGFDFEPKSRSNGNVDRGVGAHMKNGIPYTRRVDLETDDLEIIWLEINFKNCKSFVVGVLYTAPRIVQNIQTKILLQHWVMFWTNFRTEIKKQFSWVILTVITWKTIIIEK